MSTDTKMSPVSTTCLTRTSFWVALPLILVASYAAPGRAQQSKDVPRYTDVPPWDQLNDPVLVELVTIALENNQELHSAHSRILQAKAAFDQSRAPLRPSVQAEGSYVVNSYDNTTRLADIPGITMDTGPDYTQTLQALLKAAYQVDITGRQIRARQAAHLELKATRDDLDAAAMSILLAVVQAYLDAISAGARLELASEQVNTEQKRLDVLMHRFEAGSANAMEVLQQRQQLESGRSRLPSIQVERDTALYTLAVLLGKNSPDTLPSIGTDLPSLDTIAFSPSPSTEIQHPQLRAWDKRIAAAKDRERVAQRSMLPSLSLNGQVGYRLTKLNDTNHTDVWSLGAVLSVPLYQGGALRAQVHQARAATINAVHGQRQAALETEKAVSLGSTTIEHQSALIDTLNAALESASQAVEEATRRYLAGLSDYLNVLAAANAKNQLELSVVSAKTNLLKSKTTLLFSLGGNWTTGIHSPQ